MLTSMCAVPLFFGAAILSKVSQKEQIERKGRKTRKKGRKKEQVLEQRTDRKERKKNRKSKEHARPTDPDHEDILGADVEDRAVDVVPLAGVTVIPRPKEVAVEPHLALGLHALEVDVHDGAVGERGRRGEVLAVCSATKAEHGRYGGSRSKV